MKISLLYENLLLVEKNYNTAFTKYIMSPLLVGIYGKQVPVRTKYG